jgi:hypothetical protein
MKEQEKIAYVNKTLPEYVFKDEKEQWDTFPNVLNNKIKRGNPIGFNPVTLYQEINNTPGIIIPLNLSQEKIIKTYLFMVKDFIQENHLKYGGTIDQLFTDMKLTEEQIDIAQNAWRYIMDIELPGYIKDIEVEENRRFREIEKKYEEEKQYEKLLETLEPVTGSEFILEKSVRVYKIINDNLVFRNIYDMFNISKVNSFIPLISTFKFYKVLKGEDYVLEFPPTDNVMYLFTEEGKVEVTLEEITFSYDKGVDDKEFVGKVCNCLGINFDENIIAEKERLNGISYYKGQTLDKIIWSDLVTNNKIVSKKLIIDEHIVVARKRDSLFMYYFLDEEKTITLTIKEFNTAGTKIVRLRILNATSLEIATNIIKEIGYYLTIYNAEGKKIQNIYNEILGENRIKYRPPTKVDLEEFPFPPAYTRSCARKPRTIGLNSDIPLNELKQKYGKSVMRFPKEKSLTAEGIPIDSWDFLCDYKEAPYPGLKINYAKDTQDMYPFLPCCYERDHMTQKTKVAYKYYKENKSLVELRKEEETQKDTTGIIGGTFKITDKFVNYEQTGKCPELIEKLISIYTNSPVERLGVHDTKTSFLECVLNEINYDNFTLKSSANRLRTLEKELKKIDPEKVLSVCSQECWNIGGIDNLKKQLSQDIYFNPRYFIKIVELLYDCRIVLFDRDNFIHPNYIQGCVRWKPPTNNKVVLIYEHYGIVSDRAKYPRCELIKINNINPNVHDGIKNNLYNNYLSSFVTLFGNTKSPKNWIDKQQLLSSEIFKNYVIESQHIDYYGKVFAYNVKKNNTRLTLFLYDIRLPPMDIPIAQQNTLFYGDDISPDEFLVQNIIEDKVIIILMVSSNLSLKFYYLKNKKDKPEISELQQFIKEKTQVELLVHNSKYIYSEQIKKQTKFAPESVWDFIKIGKPRVYNKFLFDSSDVIYIPNEVSKKRLQYVLTLFKLRNNAELNLYSTLKTIPHLWEETYDFEKQDNCIILETDYKINWYENFYILLEANNLRGNQSFVTQIENFIYKCDPLDTGEIPEEINDYQVYFPQMKKIFMVNRKDPKDNPTTKPNNHKVYIAIKDNEELRFYKCIKLKVFME